ncbi:MAG: RluA family pseudouridine synthase, partial [Candidatus Daviesbacteria bacterium]|nr:RluA family pseudouridine synthase [Candidatus Daviesbacteria bacterium]
MESSQLIRIYEDESILVLDKPPGLVVDSGETVKEETIQDILIRDFQINLPRGGIVHRLDKDTSGIILVAKTEESLENLQSQFKERIIKKEYLALVHGLVEGLGTIEGSIGRNPGNREKFTVISPGRSQSPPSRWSKAEGKEAVTEYEPLKNLQFTIYNLQLIFNDFNKIQMRKLERQKYGEFTLLVCKPKTGRTHQIRVHL